MTEPARAPNPILAGLLCHCPNCGRGALFAGFMKVAARCKVCGFDLKAAESGDGPAVFILLVVGCIVLFGALIVDFNYRPPIWVHFAIWLPLAAVLTLALLRPFKGVMIALQYRHHAAEIRNDDF